MSRPRAQTPGQILIADIRAFGRFLYWYSKNRSYRWFVRFESVKDILVDVLYKKRGRYGRPVLHVATIGLVFAVMSMGPLVFNQGEESQNQQAGRTLLANNVYGSSFYTQQAEEVRQFRGGQVITHTVAEGDTVSSIATRYGLQPDTIIWENNLAKTAKLKPGDELRILPLDGVRHKVSRGETIYSIGKKYGLEGSEVQVIVDYPFNEFLNDETFELATGQWLMVPDGTMPTAVAGSQPGLPGRTVVKTPDAGSVTATGNFVWPAAGGISQGYRFYHKAIDIANKSGGPILAADSGTVVVAGWVDNSGYGNRIMIDHGNGYVTLYGHLSVVQVSVGQRVNRGDVIGQMGSTGRSTGTHLHFEIRQGSVLLSPLSFLQ